MTIQAVSERLQLPKSTIRYWEKEFAGFIAPERTAGGQRRYSTKDLAVLEAIKDMKRNGHSLAQIKARMMGVQDIGAGIDPPLIDQLTETIVDAVRREIALLFKGGV